MAKTIMIQGTMSSVGKSYVTTGLCRVFRQDGYSVAPFKSQNMSRNVFITQDGHRMSVAQAVQAEAAGIDPETSMNPVLLCPLTDTGSEVIVRGETRGVMGATEYFSKRKTLIPEVARAFDSLSRDYDIVVIEGAGSPAEINLREGDIANMGIAVMTDSPVMLIGDIEPGGVFAQLLGTLLLLADDERDRVKCVAINKFRGDIEILRPGLIMLREKIDKPIAGVLPYLPADIDAEDSLRRDNGSTVGADASNADMSIGRTFAAGNRGYREKQYDIIADGIREHLDMALIYSVLERKI